MAFNDVKQDRGGMSIPKRKLEEMISNGSLKRVGDRVSKERSRKIPQFGDPFGDFIVDGKSYRVEDAGDRVVLFTDA